MSQSKWTTVQTPDGFCLAFDGKTIYDNGLPEIARKLNGFDEMLAALQSIAAIQDESYGSDWQEIQEARDIANNAIAKAEAANG
jgi:hypothetical protein